MPNLEDNVTAAELAKLSTAQLTWLRRAIHAWFGTRFDDPQLHAYFQQLRWYKPMSKSNWRAVLADARWQRDPDEYFLATGCAAPGYRSGICLTLELVHKLLATRTP